MSEISRIRELYQRTLHGDAWHGDSVWKILKGVSPEHAFELVIPAAHTVWQLVAHMTFWESEVVTRLGRRVHKDRDEHYNLHNNSGRFLLDQQHYYELYNFPPTPCASSEDWARVLHSFRHSNAQFGQALLELTDQDLDQPLSSPDKSVYLEVQGVIQHHLYHAGQIAILLKNWAQTKVATGL